MFTTLDRQASGATAPAALVLTDSLSWTWPVLTLAAGAIVISRTDGPRVRLLLATFAVAVVLAPLHQAQIHTEVSLYKHVDFGAWFGAIAAGYVLGWLVRLCHPMGWRIVAAAGAVVAFSGIVQTSALYAGGWPDTAQATARLGKILPAASCPCLLMDDSVAEYYLIRKIPPALYGQVTNAFYFRYRGSASQHEATGQPAYLQAVRE
ncbi:MAG: hypothetical protein ACRDNZ_05390, partial [Streptosporangiaceae bacterium]